MQDLQSLARLELRQPTEYFESIYVVEKVIYQVRSQYQEIMVVELRNLGKTLILDGWIQSTFIDEHIYHEALVHPALSLHPEPRRVLILGGGEGATLREVLKHNTVEEAVMVDIDPVVIEVAKKYLAEWHQGAFEDPRSRVYTMDGFEYVRKAIESGERFDVVVMDLTDPFGPEIASKLYTVQAFTLIKQVLNQQGVLVLQAGCSTLFPKAYEAVENSVRRVFRYATEYAAWIPSFGYMNSFILASDSISPEDYVERLVETVDTRLRERGVKTRFFNGKRMLAMLLFSGVRLAKPG